LPPLLTLGQTTEAVLEITGYTFAADVHSLAQLSIL